jgi:hypothetical protein
VHSEGTPPPGGRHEGRYSERAETYLRLLIEAALRSPADEDITRVERAADVLIEAGVLSSQVAARILTDLRLALRAWLPVGWLADVWACGLAVLSGHLVVAVAEPGYPRARVLALPAPEAEPVTTMIRAADDGPAGLPTWQVAEG